MISRLKIPLMDRSSQDQISHVGARWCRSKQERSKAKEEAARASRAHSVAMATVEATLKAERIRCQDMRVRLERQTREHQVALTNAEERLLHNQQELDKVRSGWGGVSKIRRLTTNDWSLL